MKRIHIHLEASNLKNKAGLFKGISDPYCIVRLASSLSSELGRTKSIKNEIKHPEWVESIIFNYDEQSMGTYLKVEIWDDNRGKTNDVKMVETLMSIPKAIKAGERGLTQELEDGGLLKMYIVVMNDVYSSRSMMAMNSSTVITSAAGTDATRTTTIATVTTTATNTTNTSSYTASSKNQIVLHLRAMDVKNVEKGYLGLGKSDPFIEIRKKYNSPDTGVPRWKVVYRSEWISNHLNPMFEKTCIDLEHFCDGDLYKDLKVILYDHEPDGNHKFIGEMEITTDVLLKNVAQAGNNADRDRALEFIKGDERRRRIVGLLVIMEASLTSPVN
jgi:hypothetical protein